MIKQRDKERVKDFRYRLEKVLEKGYGPRFVKSLEPDVVIVREELLKNAFQNGIRQELIEGFYNRVKPSCTFSECVDTATEVEDIEAKKKSLLPRSVNAVLSEVVAQQTEFKYEFSKIDNSVKIISEKLDNLKLLN